MTTSIHTNTSAMIALQNLNRTNDQLAATQSRVNTGLTVSYTHLTLPTKRIV